MSRTKTNKFLTPAKAAENLGISVATLRKYSLIVERTTGDAGYFERNSQNNRLYTTKNLDDFKEMVELGHGPKMTLESAAKQIYPVTAPTEEVVDDNKLAEYEQTIADLRDSVTEKDQALADLQAQLDLAEQQLAEVKSYNQDLQAHLNATGDESVDSEIKERVNEQVHNDKKGHWWNRFRN